MKTKKLSVPLVGIGLENLRPNVAELTEPLVERGFRSLANSTPSDLPVGSLALLYNSKNGTMNFILIQKHYRDIKRYSLWCTADFILQMVQSILI